MTRDATASAAAFTRPRILLVHPYPMREASSFVEADHALLQERYDVEELSITPFLGRFVYDAVLKPGLWQAVRRNDLVFCWFGACAPSIVIARLLGKPSILVGGGGDVADVPSIGYGLSARSRLGRASVTLGFRLADTSLLFSDASRESLIAELGRRSDRLQTLYLGVDTDVFQPRGIKAPQVLTVAYITRMNLRRKGIQTFIETARLTPHISYRLAGRPVEADVVREIEREAPPNFQYLGYLEPEALLAEYQRSSVYAQLSLHEGFGMALAEAMACECVPVVTRVGSIAEVAGADAAFVQPENAAEAARAIERAISQPDPRAGRRNRQRVVDCFSMEKRRSGLRTAIDRLIS